MSKFVKTILTLLLLSLPIASYASCYHLDEKGFCWDKKDRCYNECKQKHKDRYDLTKCDNQCWDRYGPRDMKSLEDMSSAQIQHYLNIPNVLANME